MATKPDCYQCEYRGEVPGSAHSSCHHPAFQEAHASPFFSTLAILASVHRVPALNATSSQCQVKGHHHGIRMGWFNHPFNYDPTWLEECSGFTPKEVPHGQ